MGVWIPHGLATEEGAVVSGVASPEVGVVFHAINAEHYMGKKIERCDVLEHSFQCGYRGTAKSSHF